MPAGLLPDPLPAGDGSASLVVLHPPSVGGIPVPRGPLVCSPGPCGARALRQRLADVRLRVRHRMCCQWNTRRCDLSPEVLPGGRAGGADCQGSGPHLPGWLTGGCFGVS